MSDFYPDFGLIAVSRDGREVTITLKCATEYEAMIAYDKAKLGAEQGRIEFSLLGTEPPLIVGDD